MSVEIYYFDTDDDASYVLAVFYRGKRVALYTQVLNFRTIANNNVLVFENLVEQEDKTWLLKRRVGALADRKFVSFPDLNCTKFLAPDPVSGLVTYGAGTKIGDSFGPPREVCIWNENLQLQHALSVPIQNMLANSEETPNSIGLLPADKNTFYQLAFDKDHCVMRLQSLINKDNYRQIKLPMGQTYTDVTEAVITGAYGDPCWNDVAIQFDISNLTFSGGNMRFRISKSSRGDLKHDWSAWQTYQ